MDGITVEHNRRTRRGVVAGAAAGLAGLGLGFLRPPQADAQTFNEAVFADSFHLNNGAVNIFSDPNGSLELGKVTSTGAQVPFIDFHWAGASGVSQDYNARLQNDADGRLIAKFAPGGNVLLEKGNVTAASSVSGAAAYMQDGGFISVPNLATTTVRPLTWVGTLPDNLSLGSNPYLPALLHCEYRRTSADPALADGYTGGCHGIRSSLTYGSAANGVVGKGTTHNYTAQTVVERCNDNHSEQACFVGFNRYDQNASTNPSGNAGRAWMTDFNVHSAMGTQQGALQGIVMFMNNYHSASPLDGDSGNIWIATQAGNGGGILRPQNPVPFVHHVATPTYPVDVGLGIVGTSTAGPGYKTGIRIGGNRGPWNITTSRVGKGLVVQDYETHGIHLPNRFGTTATAIRVDVNAGEVLALGGLAAKTKGSVPTDADTNNTDVNGQIIIRTDTNPPRIYVRVGLNNWRWTSLDNK